MLPARNIANNPMTSLCPSSPPVSKSERKKHESLLIGVGIACLLLALLSRSPALVLKARFFAEDGKIFYQQAHELGFVRSVFVPYAGYLHLFPRLIAGLSLLLPLFYVPLFFNVAALTVQCITAVYICSARMRNVAPLAMRAVVAFLYLGLPHIGEVWGRLTNSQWHLAVLSFLILIAAPAPGRLGTWFDRVALVVGALTGPFSLLLLPIALVPALFRRSSRTIANLAIVGSGAAVQAVTLLLHGRPETGNLGASFPLLFKLLTHGLFLTLLEDPWHTRPLFSDIGYCVLVAALPVLAWILWKGSFEMRCALLLGGMVIAASLASPIITNVGEQWPAMLTSGGGERYWFIPRVVTVVAGLWVATQSFSKWARAAGVLAMVFVVIFCIQGWRIEQWPGIHFRTYAHVFNGLPVGAMLRVPIEPPPIWNMEITKKPLDWSYVDPGFRDGEILPINEWLTRRRLAKYENSSPAPGWVLRVNGRELHGTGTALAPVHVSVRGGALLEGWAVLPDGEGFRPMDEIYAIVSGRAVKGDRIPVVVRYRNTQVDNLMYLVYLPSILLHTGFQEITIVGDSRDDNTTHFCGKLYVWGDS